MKLFDEVILTRDLPYEELKKIIWMERYIPKEGLKKGAKGAIVEIYTNPSLAYEVEFFDISAQHLIKENGSQES